MDTTRASTAQLLRTALAVTLVVAAVAVILAAKPAAATTGPDFAVSVTATPSPATAGGTMTFVVTVRDLGPGAGAARLWDDLPANVGIVAIEASQGSCAT